MKVDKIRLMLDAMVDIVEDDSMPWKEKLEQIQRVAYADKRSGDAFDEFTSWFMEEEDA